MVPSKIRYSTFPKYIFGLKCSQHRTLGMRQVLRYYAKRAGTGAKKDVLLVGLVQLEKEVSDNEVTYIQSWFRANGDDETLHDQLDRIRRGEQPEMENSSEGNLYTERPCTKSIRMREPSSSTRMVECCICMESMSQDRFPSRNITKSCRHEPTVCLDCLTTSIDTQIPDVPWDQIKCPECPELLLYEVVKILTSDEMFESYDNKAFLSAFYGIPNFTMCLGPNCGSGQSHIGGEEEPIMTCNKCKFKTCFTHKMPWHPDQTCEQYDVERRERAEHEAASEKLIEESSKLCPNPKFGYRIIKISGCNHMTCLRCNQQFCWLCMAPWREIMRVGNTTHNKSCKYHTNNIAALNYRADD